MRDRLFVLTGAPGAGKTSVIDALATRGIACVAESGRAVIREERARGGTALPSADRAAFAEKMFARDVAAYRAAPAGDLIVFDRGIVDTIGYLRLCGLAVPEAMTRAAHRCRYTQPVFLAPPWAAIFTQDGERKQTFDEAVATHDTLKRTYEDYGYRCLALPLVAVAERASFVLHHTF